MTVFKAPANPYFALLWRNVHTTNIFRSNVVHAHMLFMIQAYNALVFALLHTFVGLAHDTKTGLWNEGED